MMKDSHTLAWQSSDVFSLPFSDSRDSRMSLQEWLYLCERFTHTTHEGKGMMMSILTGNSKKGRRTSLSTKSGTQACRPRDLTPHLNKIPEGDVSRRLVSFVKSVVLDQRSCQTWTRLVTALLGSDRDSAHYDFMIVMTQSQEYPNNNNRKSSWNETTAKRDTTFWWINDQVCAGVTGGSMHASCAQTCATFKED